MADKKAPAEVDLAAKFKEEAKDPAMVAYLKSLGNVIIWKADRA